MGSGGSQITHGEDLPPLSADVEQVIGAQGDLEPMAGGDFGGTQTFENREINGRVNVLPGADLVFRNCQLVGSFGAGGAGNTIRLDSADGCHVSLEDCTIICRTGADGKTTGAAKNINGWGDINVELRRCVIRGGLDDIYLGPSGSPGQIPTSDPVLPMVRVLIEDTWLGDGERVGSGHADLCQIDGFGRGYVLIRRSRFMAYNIPEGADTLITRVTDPNLASMMSTCFITTAPGSDPSNIHHIAFRDTWFEGGNYSVQTRDNQPPVEMTGCLFGLNHQFGPRTGVLTVNKDNRWGQTGMTLVAGSNNPVHVTAGELIPGSEP